MGEPPYLSWLSRENLHHAGKLVLSVWSGVFVLSDAAGCVCAAAIRFGLGADVGAFGFLERVLVVRGGDNGAATKANGAACAVVIADVLKCESGSEFVNGKSVAGQTWPPFLRRAKSTLGRDYPRARGVRLSASEHKAASATVAFQAMKWSRTGCFGALSFVFGFFYVRRSHGAEFIW